MSADISAALRRMVIEKLPVRFSMNPTTSPLCNTMARPQPTILRWRASVAIAAKDRMSAPSIQKQVHWFHFSTHAHSGGQIILD
jgi:hypothetical protein